MYKVIGIVCIITLLFQGIVGAEPITLGSYYIPSLVMNETEGTFIKILSEIEARTKLDFAVVLKPTKRIQYEFQKKQFIGYFPELEEHLVKPSCRTESFFEKKIIAVTRKNTAIVTSVKDLEGRRIGLIRGYSYGTDITQNPKIKIDYVDYDRENIKMLLKGRFDVFIGDSSSTVAAIRESGEAEQMVFDVSNPLKVMEVFFVFQDTKEGNILCEQISEAIRSMKNDGMLQKIIAGK